MKKIIYLILAVLFLFPIVAKADMGAPAIKSYTVVSKTGGEEDVYRYSEGGKLSVVGKLPAGTEVEIQYEQKYNGEYYGSFWESETNNGFIKLSNFKVAKAQEVEKSEAVNTARVLNKEGLTVFAGPGYINEEVGMLKYLDEVKSGEYNYENSWIYIEKGNLKGYVEGGVGILTKGNRIDLNTSKVYTEYYTLDRMYRGSIYVYENNEYKLIQETGAPYTQNSAITKTECRVYKDGIVDWTENETIYGELIGTIPAGVTIKPLYSSFTHYSAYYVEYNGTKGWIKAGMSDDECLDFNANVSEPTDEEPKEITTTGESYVTDVAVDVVDDNKEFKFTTKEIVIGSIILGVVIVLTAIITMILVNKKKKEPVEANNNN